MSLDMFIGIAQLENPAPSGQACKEKAQLPLIVFSFSRKVGRESLEHVKISVSVDLFYHANMCKTGFEMFQSHVQQYYRFRHRAEGVQTVVMPLVFYTLDIKNRMHRNYRQTGLMCLSKILRPILTIELPPRG